MMNLPLLFGFVVLFLLFRKYGGSFIQPLFFSTVYGKFISNYHKKCREMKRQHFESMKKHKSADPELREKGIVRVLEIGPGPGFNFEFYPENCQLTAVEVNRFFEKEFFDKQKDHPHIKMQRFVVGFAEDMSNIEDGSIDIVVSTMVLCSVRNIRDALKEIQRVLAPGGKYYYWEHIREREFKLVLMIQHLFSYTFFDICFGCQLNRESDEIIQSFDGFSKVEQQLFRTPLQGGIIYSSIFILHSSHVKGIATK